MADPSTTQGKGETPPHRYTAALANEIEAKWQSWWREHDTFRASNPGEAGFDPRQPKKFILDMFPYPSGVGLHVGHPLGYIATDIRARYLRMTGCNVLHTMGFDSFGLPAEQFAIATNTHPRVTTERNIAVMRTQLARLGLGHEARRSVSTTDPEYYRWTQWIFLRLFKSWYDPRADKARPIETLEEALSRGEVATRDGRPWSALSATERRDEIDARRLAYAAEVPVNWCPMLGTVLANEEVTADGRSERGNFPVYRRPLKQWMLRITAYAERLAKDLELVDWPEPIKLLQRNWIGRSEGAHADFVASAADGAERRIRVFTTRPDTLFGATYVVLSPEHPLVDELAGEAWDPSAGRAKDRIPEAWKGRFPGAPAGGYGNPKLAVAAYRSFAASRSEAQRSEAKDKTGVYLGARARNPVTGELVPIFIADYVLMGYGTGAIMAVPAHDQRDLDFAMALGLPVREVVFPRHMLAMRWYAEHGSRDGEVSAHWREELADFLGVVTADARAEFASVLARVRTRRGGERGGGERGGEGDLDRRGVAQAQWLEAIDAMGVRNFTDLQDRFRAGVSPTGLTQAYAGPGTCVNARGPELSIEGMPSSEAKGAVGAWLREKGLGGPAVTYKLRDWLFSRQRYWGEPFPIVYDAEGRAHAIPESMLPVLLPELENFKPESSEDPEAPVRTPLARASAWTRVRLDLGEGEKEYVRETNTMPNWAGSCWYYLRYTDPSNATAMCDSAVERYWMRGVGGGNEAGEARGGVDLYVGGVEHAVLHLLYARFWHKVLFDLGHVSTVEPFHTLFNQGYIQAYAFTDERGVYVEASKVTLEDGTPALEAQDRAGPWFYEGRPVRREYGKMGKSLKNAIAPDEICSVYGCDTLRLYEMAMGPLEASKPWNPRDIAGAYRFLQRVWRNLIDEQTGASRVAEGALPRASQRVLHKTIRAVREDMEGLRFHTVVSKLIELNNHLSELEGGVPREAAEPLILMLAPLAPHVSEELWSRVVGSRDGGVGGSLSRRAYPAFDPALAADDEVEVPVSINGKVRGRIVVPAGLDAAGLEAAALGSASVQALIEGKAVRKVIAVPGRMLNIVVA